MSDLPNHGTGWAESEVLLDLLTLYNSWEDSDASSPDFTQVQRRLRESFDLTSLRTLELITHILSGMVSQELTTRADSFNPQP